MKTVAMKLKRVLLVLLAVIMAFSVVACEKDNSASNGGTNNSSTPEPYVPPVEITVTASSDTIKKGESAYIFKLIKFFIAYKYMSTFICPPAWAGSVRFDLIQTIFLFKPITNGRLATTRLSHD